MTRALSIASVVLFLCACAESRGARLPGGGGDAGGSGDSGAADAGRTDTGAGCTGIMCGAECVDTMTDPLNCGGCGISCLDGMHCSGGTCMISCGEFADMCLGECVDVRTDVRHCGACESPCPDPANGTATCADSTCGIVCNDGFADCNGLAEDGCEADLASDATCGSCETACLSTEMCVDGMCEGSGACYTGAARILVYGPGLTLGTGMLTAGTATMTVVDEATWSAMTTADFGQYDIIWIDGANCAGTADVTYGTVQDTIATWGPAVRGRSLIMIGDPDHHGGVEATTFYNNAAGWLKQQGRNADGGRTSLFFNWGCTVYNSNAAGMVPGRGTPEQFTAVLGTPITTDTTNFCAASTTAAGTGHPVLAGLTSYWSCPLHGGFSTYPAAWTVITSGGASGNGILVRDPMPCTP